MNDADLIELWEERAAIMEFDAVSEIELNMMTDEQRKKNRKQADALAYYDLKKQFPDRVFPKQITERVRKFA